MTIRIRLDMFDDPKHVLYTSTECENNDCQEYREFPLEVDKKLFVFLKNKNNLLPTYKNKIISIAAIGPNADSRVTLQGNY